MTARAIHLVDLDSLFQVERGSAGSGTSVSTSGRSILFIGELADWHGEVVLSVVPGQ